ncbi:MAG: HAD hydrolase-like protein, partial [Treponema sp.]|nr:HAD hydrolase-like protein [Treponema sp.]
MKLKHRGLIFDLDGTLADTLGDISSSMNLALKTHGFPELPIEAYREKVGWGMKRLALLCLDEEMRRDDIVSAIAEDAVRFYVENPLRYTKLFPGISELIVRLRERKVKTAVLTNKNDSVTQQVIAGLFPPNSFAVIQGEINGQPCKPDPECVWEILIGMGLT